MIKIPYLNHLCVICGRDYQIYGSDGFCDDCMIEGDDELQKDIDEYAKSLSEGM